MARDVAIPMVPQTLGGSEDQYTNVNDYNIPMVNVTRSGPIQLMTLCCQTTQARHHTIASPVTNYWKD